MSSGPGSHIVSKFFNKPSTPPRKNSVLSKDPSKGNGKGQKVSKEDLTEVLEVSSTNEEIDTLILSLKEKAAVLWTKILIYSY